MAAVQLLLEKMTSLDKDFRYMACSDLLTELRKPDFKLNERIERKLVQQLLTLLRDINGEVQSLAAKCLPPLINKIVPELVDEIITTLVSNMKSPEEQLRDICTIALKAVFTELTTDSPITFQVCKRLIGPLLERAADDDVAVAQEALEVLNDLLSRFGRAVSPDHPVINSKLVALMKHKRQPLRKRAITCLASLAAVAPQLGTELLHNILQAMAGKVSKADTRTYVQCIGAMTSKNSSLVRPLVGQVVPVVLRAAGVEGDDELRESCLQTLEVLIRLGGAELEPCIDAITGVCVGLLSYDPNYDDSEDAMEENEEEEDDGDYSGDDDLSWKVRKSSAVCLGALVSTYPKRLMQFYDTIAPHLVLRFKDREETARVEILQTFVVLLQQTAHYHSDTTVTAGPAGRLAAMTGDVVRSVQKPLKDKSAKSRQAAIQLLREHVAAAPSGLVGFTSALLPSVYACIKDASASSNVKIEALLFLRLLARELEPAALRADIEGLCQVAVGAASDRFYKIASEALQLIMQLVYSLHPNLHVPVEPALIPTAKAVYDAVYARLGANDVDQEVKEKAILATAHVVAVLGEESTLARKQCLPLLFSRMQNEVTRLSAVKALGLIAASPLRVDVTIILKDALTALGSFLSKNSRALRLMSLQTLMVLIGSWDDRNTLELCGMLRLSSFEQQSGSMKRRRVCARTDSFSDSSAFEDILKALCPLVSAADMQASQMSLRVASAILTSSRQTASLLESGRIPLLPPVVSLCLSPAMQSSVLEALVLFFRSLMATGVVPFAAAFKLLRAPVDEGAVPRAAFATLGACAAALAVHSPGTTDELVGGFVADVASPAAPEPARLFALHALGELGRQVDLSGKPKVLDALLAAFDHPSEEVRAAAASALGQVCTGNLSTYVPFIVDLMSKQQQRQPLLLNALKELIAACVSGNMLTVLTPFAEQIWAMLTAVADAPDESTRTAAGECLGKLTLVNPEKLLGDLTARLASPSAHARCCAVVAIKTLVCFADPSPLFVPALRAALLCLGDADPTMRREVLVTFNTAAHNRPQLLVDLLGELQPLLYQETSVHPELVRVVEMGPFKHQVDDGLDARKTAFECMYSLLKACHTAVDMPTFISCCLKGLADQYDVQMLTFLIVARLCKVDPQDVLLRLDEFAAALQPIISAQAKQNAVAQETERIEELKKAAVRAVHALSHIPGAEKNGGLARVRAVVETAPSLLKRMVSIEASENVSMDV